MNTEPEVNPNFLRLQRARKEPLHLVEPEHSRNQQQRFFPISKIFTINTLHNKFSGDINFHHKLRIVYVMDYTSFESRLSVQFVTRLTYMGTD